MRKTKMEMRLWPEPPTCHVETRYSARVSEWSKESNLRFDAVASWVQIPPLAHCIAMQYTHEAMYHVVFLNDHILAWFKLECSWIYSGGSIRTNSIGCQYYCCFKNWKQWTLRMVTSNGTINPISICSKSNQSVFFGMWLDTQTLGS